MSSREALFCHVDDGCRVFEPKLEQTRLWPDNKARKRGKILTLSEIMTILIPSRLPTPNPTNKLFQQTLVTR
ncbi:putative transposase [Microcystis aeruginosa NIES-3807]|uniref:Transposase n=1 Tax=Microcystis aeruginosa NIES-3807 TaxID=2517785 RepID=A0AAD3AXS9_MICAE|nr:hypothetical protein [Microcystis aeruginosa]GCL57974.1 putative transposase [Microcystis aeruginosa NIES-3807]